MMQILKPRALKPGDVIGIAAPASPPASEEHLARGIRYLELCGFRVELGKHLYRKSGYLAGTDHERVSDIHDLFSNKHVRAIFTVRGGYGCTRILPLLNYRLIRNNPKTLVGYSDITALQLALFTKAGITSYTGPMVAVEMAGKFSGEPEERFWRSLTSKQKPASLTIDNSLKRIIRPGKAEGILFGGNLSLIASLVGTTYFPRCRRSLLLLEEIGEKPYRVNRMLNQLRLSGVLKHCSGVALGVFVDCQPETGKPSLTLQQVFDDSFSGFTFPVAGHFQYGHIDNIFSIPIGVQARLDTNRRKLVFLENAVE